MAIHPKKNGLTMGTAIKPDALSYDTRPFNFTERSFCVSCGHTENQETLYNMEFTSPELQKFIQKYYKDKLAPSDLGNGTYTIVHCKNCNLLYQKHVLNDSGLGFLYESAICPEESLKKRERAQKSYFYSLIESASVVFEFNPDKTPRDIQVLDFGMGWGHWAVAAQALGMSVKGAELSEKRINFAQSLGINVVDLKTNQEKFDFINTDQVFEHLENPLEIGKLLHSKLKKGGILKIFVPDAKDNLEQLLNQNFEIDKNSLHPLEHINAFDWESLINFAANLGLRPVQIHDALSLRMKARCLKQFYFSKKPCWYFIKEN